MASILAIWHAPGYVEPAWGDFFEDLHSRGVGNSSVAIDDAGCGNLECGSGNFLRNGVVDLLPGCGVGDCASSWESVLMAPRMMAKSPVVVG